MFLLQQAATEEEEMKVAVLELLKLFGMAWVSVLYFCCKLSEMYNMEMVGGVLDCEFGLATTTTAGLFIERALNESISQLEMLGFSSHFLDT